MALQHADFPSGQTGLYGATESYLLNGIYAQADSVTLSEDPDPNVTGNVLEVGGVGAAPGTLRRVLRSEEHTSELQSLMRISYAVFFLNKNTITHNQTNMYHVLNKRETKH